MEKVSIVVPAYNAEGTLRYCINSILNQSYKDIEVIIVDDGSTDQTFWVAAELQKRDSRIILKKKSNGGVSSARNFGIKYATGNYIAFVDADDKLKPEMVEKLMNARDADVVVSDIYQRMNDLMPEGEKVLYYDLAGIKSEFPNLYERNFFNSVCGKLYKVKAIECIWFDETIRVGEDLLFNFEVFKRVEKVAVVNFPGYIYVNNVKSATHKFNPIDFEQQKILRNAANKFGSQVLESNNNIEAVDVVYLRNTADVIINLITFEKRPYLKKELSQYLADEYYKNILIKYKIKLIAVDKKRKLILHFVKNKNIKLLQIIGVINKLRYIIKLGKISAFLGAQK